MKVESYSQMNTRIMKIEDVERQCVTVRPARSNFDDEDTVIVEPPKTTPRSTKTEIQSTRSTSRSRTEDETRRGAIPAITVSPAAHHPSVTTTGLTLREQIRQIAERIWCEDYVRAAQLPRIARDLAIHAFVHDWPRQSTESRAVRLFLKTYEHLGSVAESCPAVA